MGYIYYNAKDIDDSYVKKPESNKLFFECGFHPQDAVFEIDDGAVEDGQYFVLDRVIVDTTGLKKPTVKLDFSSLIVFEGESERTDSEYEFEVEVNLLFRLEKVCNGVAQTVQTWEYLKEFDVEGQNIDELEIEISEPFTVTLCDRACPGCCEYRMVVEGKDFEGEFDALRVVKPNLTALISDMCH